MKYLQNERYGCALYAVGNIFPELTDYVTSERIELSKKGILTAQLNNWLREDGKSWAIDVWYYDHEGGKIPDKYFENYKPVESDALPVLFSVKNEGGLNHVIGAHILKDGSVEVFDSLKKQSEFMQLKDVNNLYDHVFGFYCFVDVNDPSGYIQLWNEKETA